MNLTYTMRLLCLCCASFFMIHLALAYGSCAWARARQCGMAEHMKPSSAARFLFALRMAPAGDYFVCGAGVLHSQLLCGLSLEATGEKVGFVCFLTAVMGVAIWTLAIVRVAGAVRGTARYLHRCEQHGRKITVPGQDRLRALLLADKAPVLAVAGVLRPQLVVSRRVMHGLSVRTERRRLAS